MLDNVQNHPESFKCSSCGADIGICSLHLMPGNIFIKEVKIVIRSSQQIFKLSEKDYELLFDEFRDSSLADKVIKISCSVCKNLFCELSQGQSAWLNNVLETNSMKFCRN